MKCTHCAMDQMIDARFCARCGQAIQEESSLEDTSSAVSDVTSGKVQTSPFPTLPDTGSALALSALKLNGSAVHALLAQANLHRMRREWDLAIECCVSVLRAQPANQTAHVLLGDIYRDQRRFADSVQWYGMAVELRPNPTDQAKLEFATQERDRLIRQEEQKARQGYGNSASAPIDRGTDLNTGTTNLMGVSPRRWLRGITVTSLAFAVLVLAGLVWTSIKNPRLSSTSFSNNSTAGYPTGSGNSGLPPHRLDRTIPSYIAAQSANKDNGVVVGGGGLPADRNMRSASIAPGSSAVQPGGKTSGYSPASSGRSAAGLNSSSGMTGPNIPSASVQNVRPLPTSFSSGSSTVQPSASIASPQPSNRLTDGVQLSQNVSDGSVGASLMLTAAPSLILEGGARGQDSVLRNVYRAARGAFAGSNILMRVKVFVQTQVPGTGLSVVMEAEVDRSTAMKTNPDTEDAALLQSHLSYYRFSGASQDANPAASSPANSGNSAGSGSPSQ